MPASARQIVPEDLLPDTEFAKVRGTRRAALLATKRLRRIALGPYCTFYFESFETMLFQVQEMLLIEKGGAAQMADELAAYNPLIPQGSELVATMMFELDDPIRRARLLAGLGGVEDRLYIEVAGERIFAEPESDVERTRDDGKTSSVHFLRFRFTPALVKAFQNEETQAKLGCDDPRYSHIAILAPESRRELATDFD